MKPRTMLLTILALVAGTGALIQNREKILLELGLESWDPAYYRALELAKSARTLQRYHTNYFTIKHRLLLEGAEIDPDGWTVERLEGRNFMARYRSKAGKRIVEYDFEVDVGLREVYLRKNDPERPNGITDDQIDEPPDGEPEEGAAAPPGSGR